MSYLSDLVIFFFFVIKRYNKKEFKEGRGCFWLIVFRFIQFCRRKLSEEVGSYECLCLGFFFLYSL